MEKVLEIIVAIFLIALWLTIMWRSIMNKKWKQFDMFLKDGDLVYYYSRKKRNSYRVKNVGAIFCEIIYNGKTIKVERINLLPNLWYRYEPLKPIE